MVLRETEARGEGRELAERELADVGARKFGNVFVDGIVKAHFAALDRKRQQRRIEHLATDARLNSESGVTGRLLV